MSGLGKGIVASSVGKLLQLTGLKVTCTKIDPYVNYDAGTMNPTAHGEVFVTDDGGECDMDMGNYERFLNTPMTKWHNITTGRIYSDVIKAEREGKYLGQCVQIIPHVTDVIKNSLKKLAKNYDILVVECGGTVGDIESLPFLESFRQMELEQDDTETLFIHVTLAPILDVVGEQKTKPTQHSVQELRRIGIHPYILAVRCQKPLNRESRHKISMFASVREQCVISCHDSFSIYNVPEILKDQGIIDVISDKLDLKNRNIKWMEWKKVTDSFFNSTGNVNIGIVGKYVNLPDSYVSVYQALLHSSAKLGKKLSVEWIDSEKFENSSKVDMKILNKFDGILVPGGFGARGSEGIINSINYARMKNIPFLGICFGFQLSLIEFARNQCGINNASSQEFNPKNNTSVVKFMPEQEHTQKNLGGSMRLGKHDITILPKTLANKIYQSNEIQRRHRHRYEFNQDYRQIIEENGMILSGHSDKGRRIEILEIPSNKFFFAVQYHSEFNSIPGRPEEAFGAFITSCA
jgi:CTP synthase